ncbi:MAG: penicillin acylase family protein, partial [Woeseiaceae bacterium]
MVGSIACIRSEGTFHAVEIEFPTYFANVVGDGVQDNLADVTASLPQESQVVASVPFRSFGPVIDITDPGVLTSGGITSALIVQFTGFHATRELEAFLRWNRASGLDDFVAGLNDFDVGAQNWSYADADGNIAYFSSAEAPLRKDLELGTVADGLGPAFIRNGSGDANWVADPGQSQGQAIPYAILPFDEMPQTINPANGFFVTANNDPAGTTLDNNPLNQPRPSNSSAIYYLASGYANGLRAGRITRLLQAKLDDEDSDSDEESFTVKDMKKIQANTQQLDAELMMPFLLEAFANADKSSAPGQLAALAGDTKIAEAIGRLADWDFSTPTGIPNGYDAKDKDGRRRSLVKKKEANKSIAATIYNVWRAKAIRSTIDSTLGRFGLGVGSSDALKDLYALLSRDPYTGMSTAGDVDFFAGPTGLSAEERRDLVLLSALREALDALASDDFAAAFGHSTDQEDYRWGKLHRITFDHPFVPAFSIPPTHTNRAIKNK